MGSIEFLTRRTVPLALDPGHSVRRSCFPCRRRMDDIYPLRMAGSTLIRHRVAASLIAVTEFRSGDADAFARQCAHDRSSSLFIQHCSGPVAGIAVPLDGLRGQPNPCALAIFICDPTRGRERSYQGRIKDAWSIGEMENKFRRAIRCCGRNRVSDACLACATGQRLPNAIPASLSGWRRKESELVTAVDFVWRPGQTHSWCGRDLTAPPPSRPKGASGNPNRPYDRAGNGRSGSSIEQRRVICPKSRAQTVCAECQWEDYSTRSPGQRRDIPELDAQARARLRFHRATATGRLAPRLPRPNGRERWTRLRPK
jgi:hypothetical protein